MCDKKEVKSQDKKVIITKEEEFEEKSNAIQWAE